MRSHVLTNFPSRFRTTRQGTYIGVSRRNIWRHVLKFVSLHTNSHARHKDKTAGFTLFSARLKAFDGTPCCNQYIILDIMFVMFDFLFYYVWLFFSMYLILRRTMVTWCSYWTDGSVYQYIHLCVDWIQQPIWICIHGVVTASLCFNSNENTFKNILASARYISIHSLKPLG